MPRGPRNLQVSFAGGEMSPEMFSRQDDQRFRSGAARLRNFVSHPRGSVARRPGFGLVRETKDLAYRSRLIEFEYSEEDSYAIEMGRADISGARNAGYFRFHTEGATLLQPKPRDYVFSETITVFNEATDELTLGTTAGGGTTHNFQTGDPVVLTVEPTGTSFTAGFLAGSARITTTALHYTYSGDTVLFRGSVPPEIAEGVAYYVVFADLSQQIEISNVRNGVAITFSTTVGSIKMATLPRPLFNAQRFNLVWNHRYFAVRIGGTPSTQIQLAPTRTDAMAGTVFDWENVRRGTMWSNDFKVHYDYRQGAVVNSPEVVSPSAPYYMFRTTPWGTPEARTVWLQNHNGHVPGTATHYWQQMPGLSSTAVTFSLSPNHTVDWGSVHGLAEGVPVVFTEVGTLAAPIVAGQVYYVRNPSGTKFQISASLPGPILLLGGTPVGLNEAFANGIFEVPHFYSEDDMFAVTSAQSGDVLSLAQFDRPFSELRRRAAYDWVLKEISFNAQVDPPDNLSIVAQGGEGFQIENWTNTLASKEAFTALRCLADTDPVLQPGEEVWLTNIEDIPGTTVYISDGAYIVEAVSFLSPNNFITLQSLSTGAPIQTGAVYNGMSVEARVRLTQPFYDDTVEYVVTALDANNEESIASAPVSKQSNLSVASATNTINWDAVTGATRYRIYKEFNGLFGYIGETDIPTTAFVDDHIDPDMSITPPIEDKLLYEIVTLDGFDIPLGLVQLTDHELEAGAPIIFSNDDSLPTGLPTGVEPFITYYVLNPTADDFELAATPGGTTPVPMSGAHTGRSFAQVGQFPSAVCYFEQRRVFGGARLRPQDFWLTASGTETDLTYSIPTRDADRIQNRLAARKRSDIRHAIPVGHLLLMTSSSEFRVTPLNSDALTPTSVSARAPTQVGTSRVAPVVVNNAVLFAAKRGGHVREIGFSESVGDYLTGDVSLRAAHLFDDKSLVQLAYQSARQPTVWAVSSGGTLVAMTYIPEEQIAGWHEHDIAGTFESCIAIPEGEEDRIYVVTKRGGVRYVERMGSQYTIAREDVFYVDFGVTYDDPLLAITTVFVPHLANQAVIYLADGVEGSGTVSAAGILTLSVAANKVHVGLAYTGELHTIPLGMQIDLALGSGRHFNINKAWVRVYESGGFQVGPNLAVLSDSPAPAAGQLDTKPVEVLVDGEWKLDGQLYITQSGALPLSIAGLTYEVEPGA